jgi:hypothetical protein
MDAIAAHSLPLAAGLTTKVCRVEHARPFGAQDDRFGARRPPIRRTRTNEARINRTTTNTAWHPCDPCSSFCRPLTGPVAPIGQDPGISRALNRLHLLPNHHSEPRLSTLITVCRLGPRRAAHSCPVSLAECMHVWLASLRITMRGPKSLVPMLPKLGFVRSMLHMHRAERLL